MNIRGIREISDVLVIVLLFRKEGGTPWSGVLLAPSFSLRLIKFEILWQRISFMHILLNTLHRIAFGEHFANFCE